MLIWCKKIIVACCQQNRVYNEGADVAGGEERDEKDAQLLAPRRRGGHGCLAIFRRGLGLAGAAGVQARWINNAQIPTGLWAGSLSACPHHHRLDRMHQHHLHLHQFVNTHHRI